MPFRNEGLAAGLFGLLLLCGCGAENPAAGLSYPTAESAVPDARAVRQKADARAEVSVEEGLWRVAYDFDEPQNALIFPRAAGTRAGRWRPLTPGVRITRAGGFDAMIFDEPASEAAFAFEPHTAPIDRDYTPFLPFTDGGLALFTGWFEVVAAESLAAIEASNGRLGDRQGGELRLATTVSAPGPLVAEGGIVDSPHISAIPGGTYVYTGPGRLFEGESLIGVIDPGLPAWLKARLDGDLYSIFLAHESAWGMPLRDKATVFVAFRGAEEPGFSNKGSVIGQVLAASVSGQAMMRETPQVVTLLNWFFAHEAAHLFHRAAGAPHTEDDDAWMHEGAASAMAHGIAGALGGEADYTLDRYAEALDRCDSVLSEGPGRTIEGAGRRNEIAYDCGALIALISDALVPDRGIAEIWREAGRGWAQGAAFHTSDYLAVLSRLGAEREALQALADLIEMSHPDPKAAIVEVMQTVGLAPVLDEEGRLKALDFAAV